MKRIETSAEFAARAPGTNRMCDLRFRKASPNRSDAPGSVGSEPSAGLRISEAQSVARRGEPTPTQQEPTLTLAGGGSGEPALLLRDAYLAVLGRLVVGACGLQRRKVRVLRERVTAEEIERDLAPKGAA